MAWDWIWLGVLILGWLAILWGLFRFFMSAGDEEDD
jgi:hypothetical protein